MILNVMADGQNYPLDVPDNMLSEAKPVFDKMDADMDNGWQMGREWLDKPDSEQRCQIAADKLLTALENQNQNMATMMAAYILSKAPHVQTVVIDTNGELTETHFM
jgi:hypothetical protein